MMQFGGMRIRIGRGFRMGAVAAGACLALAGCAGQLLELPGQGPAPHIYDLSASGSSAAGKTSVSRGELLRLHVAEPVASRALNTDKIVLRISQVEMQNYKNAMWSDRAPRLVQDYLVDSIDNTGAVELVSGDRTTARGRYVVTSYLRSFEAVYDGASRPDLVVRLKIVLEDRLGAKILDTRLFEAHETASADRIEPIVEAMGLALDRVAAEAVPWILSSFEKAQKATPKPAAAVDRDEGGADLSPSGEAVSPEAPGKQS